MSNSSSTYKDLLKIKGINYYLITLFLGAFNDNCFKILLILLAKDKLFSSANDLLGGGSYVAVIGVVFIIPFLLFSGYAGYVSDAFNKKYILIVSKFMEVIIMFSTIFLLPLKSIYLILPVLFFMATQSAFFSPTKYSIIPGMLPKKYISKANGLVEMSTVTAIVLGTAVGAAIFDLWPQYLEYAGFFMFSIAVVGWATSCKIPRVSLIKNEKVFHLNPFYEIQEGLKKVKKHKIILLSMLGLAWFWFLGGLFQAMLVFFGENVLRARDFLIGLLNVFIAFGLAVGSLLAGKLSGDRIELGLIPLGAVGIILGTICLSFTQSYYFSMIYLIVLGVSGGFFIVPLNSLIQHRAGKRYKGQILATVNFFGFVGISLAFAIFPIFYDYFKIEVEQIILVFALLTLVATSYVIWLLPDFLTRFILWIITHTIYKIKVIGRENIPERGPVLLVCNHMSYVDGFLLGAALGRFVRFMLWAPIYNLKIFNWFFKLLKIIPVYSGRKSLLTIRSAQKALSKGEIVCIFSEGEISRTGNILPFKKGLEVIERGINVPIIPVHLDRMWGSVFSFFRGPKFPNKFPYPCTVSFGKPLPSDSKAFFVRQKIMELSTQSVKYRRKQKDILSRIFIKQAKKNWSKLCVSDSSHKKLTYGQTLIASLLLRKLIKDRCLNEKNIGIVLPATVGGVLINVAIGYLNKVPININFTAGTDVINSITKQCKIKTIITSRRFLSKFKLVLPKVNIVFLEDLFVDILKDKFNKLLISIQAYCFPYRLLWKFYGDKALTENSLATIVFTSGTTGMPKGVMLSHHNIISNIEGVLQIFPLTKPNSFIGILPFFHCFGYTGTLWVPLLAGSTTIYHHNPMDAKTVGKLVQKFKPTYIVGTPTFYKLYNKVCNREQFSSLTYAIAGAENLDGSVAKNFKNKFGIELFEGYGCTEMGPVISVNIPNIMFNKHIRQIGCKHGSVGQPIPGIAVKIVDPNSFKQLPLNKSGLLLVSGPSLMQGYLNSELNLINDKWYNTGDIAYLDNDGFVYIIDRLKRFSKIGGEMVPHIRIEQEINKITGNTDSLVFSMPDEKKGERIVAIYVHDNINPKSLYESLNNSVLPKLWIPKQKNIFLVDVIPLLGSGKPDIIKAKQYVN